MTDFIVDDAKTRYISVFQGVDTAMHHNAKGQLLFALSANHEFYAVNKYYPETKKLIVSENGDVDGPVYEREIHDRKLWQDVQNDGAVTIFQIPEKFNLNMVDIKRQSHDGGGLAKLEMFTESCMLNTMIACKLALLRMGDNIKSMLGINVREPEQLAKDQAAKLQRSFDLK